MHHWARDEQPAFFNAFDQPSQQAQEELVAGLEQRLLSRDQGGASTSLVRLPAGWRGRALPADVTAELFVVEGSVTLAGTKLGVGGYGWLPRGDRASELATESGAHAYLFWTPGMAVGAETAARAVSFWDEPWQEGLLDRKLPQRWKSLRLPDSAEGAHGGPAGLLRVMQWLPGFVAPKEHLHSTWEELIFLSGDWFAERGVVAAGTFLGNPADWWHAPVTTRDGALAIVHATAPLDLEQRDCEGGEEFCRAYLERASWLELPRHAGPEIFDRYGVEAPGEPDKNAAIASA